MDMNITVYIITESTRVQKLTWVSEQHRAEAHLGFRTVRLCRTMHTSCTHDARYRKKRVRLTFFYHTKKVCEETHTNMHSVGHWVVRLFGFVKWAEAQNTHANTRTHARTHAHARTHHS